MGTAHLLSKTEIDGVAIPQLEIMDSAPASGGAATGAGSGGALSAAEETLPFGSRSGYKRLPMNKGAHEASIYMSLSAGHSGIADNAVKAAIRAALTAAVDAINKLTRAAVTAVNALLAGRPVPDQVTSDLKEGAGSALTAARTALAALFRALRNLIFQSRAYVKLFTSLITLECVPPST
jgi:phage-related tail protein